MGRRRGSDGPAGVLNLLKPPGMTSHDVVAVVRRLTGQRRVGHTGTLDPGAAGVLVLCLGRATRLAEYVTDGDKAYRAEITFGVSTDSLDAQGAVVGRRPAGHLSAGDVAAALGPLRGEILQVPPMVSAVRVGGERLYERARRGETVARAPRPVTVYSLELREFRPGPEPLAFVDVRCSRGTYVRTLAADLGAALGTGAHLSFLVRTAVGPFALADAITLETLQAAAAAGRAAELCLPVEAAVAHLRQVVVSSAQVTPLQHGRAPAGLTAAAGEAVALLAPDGSLLAVARGQAGPKGLRLEKVLC